MPSAIKLVKKEARERQIAESKKSAVSNASNNPNGLEYIANTVYWAWTNFNADNKASGQKDNPIEQVRKLIVFEADKLVYLIDDTPKEIMNHYALHAVLFILVDKQPADILAQMSDASIQKLQKAISVAQERPQPDYAKLEQALASEYGPQNQTMRNALQMQIGFKKYWDCMIKELNKWSNAVDGFHRTASMSKAEKYANEEVWTMKEAPVKFGLASENSLYNIKSLLGKAHPELKKTIDTEWFVYIGGKKYFRAKFFDDFQALRMANKAKSENSAKKTKVKKQDKKQPAQTKHVSSTDETKTLTEVFEQPKDLVELKGLDFALAKLMQKKQGLDKDLGKAEESHKAVLDQMVVSEPGQRDALYDQAKAINRTIVSYQADAVSVQQDIAEANSLAQAKREAEEALCAVNEKIAAFLAKFEPKEK